MSKDSLCSIDHNRFCRARETSGAQGSKNRALNVTGTSSRLCILTIFPPTRPASEFQVTLSPTLNVLTMARFCSARRREKLELVAGLRSTLTGPSDMLDFNAELESAKTRISEIRKSIVLQEQVLRQLSDRGMDKTLGERMLDVRRHYLRRTTAHAALIESRIATTSQLKRIAERSTEKAEATEKAVELQNNLA
jgi:hypothetical protein